MLVLEPFYKRSGFFRPDAVDDRESVGRHSRLCGLAEGRDVVFREHPSCDVDTAQRNAQRIDKALGADAPRTLYRVEKILNGLLAETVHGLQLVGVIFE